MTHGAGNLARPSGPGIEVTIHREVPAEIVAAARSLAGFSLYHDEPWQRVLGAAFGWRVSAVTAHRGGRLVAYLPFVRKRRLGRRVHVCLPLSHDAGLVAEPGDSEAIEQVIASVSPLEIHAQIPGQHDPEGPAPEQFESVIEFASGTTPGKLLQTMASGHRNKVRRAQRAGIATETSRSEADFRIYSRLQSITRRRQGSPDYPGRFFPAIARELAASGHAELRLGYLEDQPVAGIVVLQDSSRNRTIFGYAASVDDREILATGVNQLLLWEAIEAALGAGRAAFSLGSTPTHHKTLLTYKQRFGAQTIPLPRIRMPQLGVAKVKEGGLLHRTATPVLRAMPLGMFRTLTPRLLVEVV